MTSAPPASPLPPECARLVETLRELRSRSGLSLAALGSRTPYSKSSWERYLNGKALPPRQAVEALCRVAGEHPGRPTALWELADAVWSGRAGAPSAEPAGGESAGEVQEIPDAHGAAEAAEAVGGAATLAPAPPVRPRTPAGATASGAGRSARRRARARHLGLAALGALVCAGVFALTLALWPTSGEARPARETTHADKASQADQPDKAEKREKVVVGCRGAECTGRNPVQMRCGAGETPRTLRTVRTEGRTLDIRFQPRCGAAWVRMWGQRVGDRVEIVTPGVKAQREVIDDAYETGQRRSTPMAAVSPSATGEVRACLVRKGGGRTCFGPGD
ncbi:hypothetical protein GCM10009801_29450 [Streptomyces albiaxialis]|uniref:HTH cro/C1-type domain-containing protein n=1 Tax=Streptomyces albiaxialis TaxID=329523 RepID=A0ABP5HI84_9ACTN